MTTELEAGCLHDDVVAIVIPRLSARVQFGNETFAKEYSSGCEDASCGWLVLNADCARPSPTTMGRSLL